MSIAIFGDEIFTATDLNRRPGQVLDEAMRRPVTITRNDETFALLLRKDAARMVAAAANAKEMVDLVTAFAQYGLAGKPIPKGHPLEWLNAFDIDELRGLLAEAQRDFHRALNGEISWDEFGAVLDEWHESAIASRSETLAAAFAAPTDEVPLTPAPTEDSGADG